ncbi:hypothetical protein M3G03_01565 [Aestuariimicrobium sp. p3-SID1156]|uniref:hypothetical protein n=1 Tax=Aestuariimicrobium sp. p3-SID1156 TaxID=2916038 RepID=UPI00223C52BF|nr:hypothetical protein [Aestuariimicrobium sp. p3-SID1156]MCT1458241.1 hypothetical protein [Aestuariimicrobium sp. p3-SID1156]
MRVSRRTLALSLLLAPAVVACDEELEYPPGGSTTPSATEHPAFMFQVIASTFNGWDPSATPTPETQSVAVVPKNRLTTQGLSKDMVFTIEKLEGQRVTFTTSEKLSDKGVFDGETLFTVAYGEELKLHTPSMDVVVDYVISLQPGA